MAELLTLQGRRLADNWQTMDDDAALPSSGDLIVSLARWDSQTEMLNAHAGQVGVYLDNNVDVLEHAESLLKADLIALDFPAFTDGRAYSQARLLRERLNYQGSIRACGDVLHDQLFYMARCGFDQFEFPGNLDDASLMQALSTFSTAYQPTRSSPTLSQAGIIKGGI
ncbi:MAG: DUF934 domain-containing protein [Oceanococcus sp.]